MDDTKSQTPRRIKIALIVSLAVNVLVIGAVIGAAFQGGRHGAGRDRGKGPEAAAIGIYGRALDQTDRRAIGKALRKGRKDQNREFRAELGGLAQQAADLLKQSPFDQEAFAALLQQQQQMIKGRSDEMQIVLVDRVASMTPAQRIAYADRLQHALKRGGKRKKWLKD
ncbi:periplasmic heavy metal sensor [uncultured Litoreibacter sp.]|uniref:periplasmic heavy metal sensor n=1 Tax=uncultured Litoreibacter sp. TaxID=1392394 RepID=UPI002624A2D2|nr:periplasmic heavy metal sensor [uncultured Litoreibacter sp.]